MGEEKAKQLSADAEAEQRLAKLVAVEKAREEVIQKAKTQRLAMIVVPILLAVIFLGPFVIELLKDIFGK